nr:hypothetical protein [Tanacetum cinerariifolium]
MNTQKHVEQQITQKTNVPVLPSTGVDSFTNASGSKPRSNTKKNRISPAKSFNKKTVEENSRTNKSNLQKSNRADSSISSKRTVINLNSNSVCQTCNKFYILANNDMCVIKYLNSVNASSSAKNVIRKVKQVWKPNHVKQVWKATGIVLTTVGYQWKPTGRIFTLGEQKHSCYVRDSDGVELIKGSQSSNFYTISVEDMMKSSPICLLSKASKTKSWLWHHRLNHLNFGKSIKHNHSPKTKNTNLEVLNALHMDLCGPMRVQTINRKKYILVIVDDYTRFTCVKFLRLEDETPEVVINFLKQIQVGLNKTIRFIHTDNGTKFVKHDLTHYYGSVGIFHQKLVLRTPQKNVVVERRNCTLVEATRTMLIFSKALMFLWAEAVPTACYTQNRSLIHTRHNKTPYELLHNKKPNLTFLCVFGALCYPINDSEDLGKLQPIADIGIFVGYAPSRKGYKIYNKRTRQPPRVERPISPTPAILVSVNSAGTPSSTFIDQYAPSPSHSLSSSALRSSCIHQGVTAKSTIIDENPFAPVDNDPFINIFALEPTSKASLSRDASSAESTYSQLTNAKTTSVSLSEELTRIDAKLSKQTLTFVGTTVESLVRKLLSSDEFHVTLARVASLGINYGAGKGLRMGRTDVEFVAAIQKVFNFYVGSKDDFDNALDDFPTTLFPFLSKIAATSKGEMMAEVNVPAQAPIRTDEHILPHSAWLQIGKSNLLLNFVPRGKRDEVFGVDIPTHLVTEAIRNSPYYQQYMNLVAKQPKAKEGAKKKIVSKAVISKKPAPVKQIKPALAKQPKSPKKKPSKLTPSRKVQKGKPYLKLVDEEEVQHEPEPQDEETNVNLERTIKMSLDLSQP